MSETKNTQPKDIVAIVTGIQIGEETKGAAVEWLAQELDAHAVIRNGGCQAGHHVVTSDGREQVFSHFAASTFNGTTTYLRYMVFDPVSLFREAQEIESKGVNNPFSVIAIDGKNISITPFHGAFSRLKEILRSQKKGTVGMGVGDAVKDALQGKTTIRANDFLKDKVELTNMVERIRQHKIQQAIDLIMALGIEELPADAYSQMNTLHDEELVLLTVQSFKYLADLVRITDEDYFDQFMKNPGNIVTEPSHGALLHPYAFAPHSTQVDPTSKELIQELKLKGTKRIVRLGVGRCYMTRHGAGPLVSFDRTMTDSIHETHNAANPWANEWLGEFRIGHYDLIATRYGLDIAGGSAAFDGFMMSYLDVLNTYQRWGVVEAYTFDGEDTDLRDYFEMDEDLITGIRLHSDTRDEAHYNHQLRLTELLKKCSPVVTYLYPTEDKSLEEIFIDYVEGKTGVPIVALSRGPKAEDREKTPAWDTVFSPNLGKERVHESSIHRPFGVDLYYAGQKNSSSLSEVLTDKKLIKEAAQRREVNTLFATIFNKIPDPTVFLDQAIEEKLVSSQVIDELYEKLAEFINSDKNHGRIILYLPSQFLPLIKAGGKNTSGALQFADAYKHAWMRLVHESEPRASYVDGDLLEEGMGNLVRVRKAGHLIPDILRSGLINLSEIASFYKINEDLELFDSLTAGLLVAREKNLISDTEWHPLQNLLTLRSETLKVSDAVYSTAVSPERIKWKESVRKSVAIGNQAEIQAKKVQADETTIDEVLDLHSLIGIRTIMRIGEQLAKTDIEKAQMFVRKNLIHLERQWKIKEEGAPDAVLTALSHWIKLGIVQDLQLQTFDVHFPDLSSPFPLDLEKIEVSDLGFAVEVVEKIGSHPILSKYIFPIFVEVGSRVKGQAGFETDYDGGVVFRPETTWEKRTEILQIIRQDIPELGRVEKLLEFWLDLNENGYGLKTAPFDIKTVVNPIQAHFFFNGIWTSQAPEFQKISVDLIKKYVDLSRFADQKDEVRRQLLRQIEIDMLQYRLMHKGYRQFYPSYKDEGTAQDKMIDWGSDYWDPQYRRIATQLFLSRVFLPDLS